MCRHCLRTTQPVYGFWYFFMIHRGIGSTLQKLMPKLVPRNDKDVDALLDCKLRVYVLIFCIFCIFCIFYKIFVSGSGRTVQTSRKFHWSARASNHSLTTSFGFCRFPPNHRLMNWGIGWSCRRIVGSPSAKKSGQSTCWSKLPRISKMGGKLGLQRTAQALVGKAPVPLEASQPLESPRGCALNELVLCACACGMVFDCELHLRTQ